MSHDHAAHAEHADSGHDGHGGLGKYLAVGAALGILTLISFVVGGNKTLMHDAPQVGRTVMIAVSCAKAMLVMLFFMHLIWEANWKYVLTVPASIMSLFLMLMLVPDIGLRTRHYSEERLLRAAPAAEAVPLSPLEQAELHEGEPHTESHKKH